MKLFQQLLVAPAALGLLATGANAAELNINGVSDYAASRSGDQRHPVLRRLPHRLGLSGSGQPGGDLRLRRRHPNGTFRGNRAMTRYEAAALLNACLDRIMK